MEARSEDKIAEFNSEYIDEECEKFDSYLVCEAMMEKITKWSIFLAFVNRIIQTDQRKLWAKKNLDLRRIFPFVAAALLFFLRKAEGFIIRIFITF